MVFEKVALARIEEAIRNGEFDNLPGRGKPIDLNDYFAAPEDLRAAYGILKNAGVLPEEAQLLKDIHELQERLAQCSDKTAERELRGEIERKWLSYRLARERYQRKRHPRRRFGALTLHR